MAWEEESNNESVFSYESKGMSNVPKSENNFQFRIMQIFLRLKGMKKNCLHNLKTKRLSIRID